MKLYRVGLTLPPLTCVNAVAVYRLYRLACAVRRRGGCGSPREGAP